jgi:hypothetical protein
MQSQRRKYVSPLPKFLNIKLTILFPTDIFIVHQHPVQVGFGTAVIGDMERTG